jgi:alpha-glucosidase
MFDSLERKEGSMRSAATHAALLAATLLLTPLGSTRASTNADQQVVRSPNGRLVVTVAIGEALSWTVEFEGQPLLGPASLSMTLGDGRSLGEAPHLLSAEMRSVDETMQPIIPVKTSTVRNTYSELVLDFGDYDLIIRAYDDAAAYRFRTRLQGEITVRAEEVAFAFGGDHRVYFPREDGFVSHNERTYQERSLASIAEGELASLPTLVAIEGGPKVLVTEADLRSYPGLWLEGTGTTTLRGTLPAYVLEEKMTNDRDSEVVRRADYLARTTGTRSFPWRVAVVAARDADLLENQTVYLLSGEIEIDDTSWIRPGKVAWDWWNANNLFGVDFEAGVNTATYQHYIDFAARFGIEYIVLDEGWYVLGDLLTTAPDMDVPRLSCSTTPPRKASRSSPGSYGRRWRSSSNRRSSSSSAGAPPASRSISCSATTSGWSRPTRRSRARPPNDSCWSTSTAPTSRRASGAASPTSSRAKASKASSTPNGATR